MSQSISTLIAVFGILALFSCSSAYKKSLGPDTEKNFTRVYLTNVDTAWQATLDAMKNSRLDISNREGGFIQTKWTENTADKNFGDAFGTADVFLKAEYRFKVSVAKGFYNGQSSVKVSVQKDQRVQKDVLEGMRYIETDSVEENTLLYRIGRIIWMRMRLAEIEDQKTKSEIDNTKF